MDAAKRYVGTRSDRPTTDLAITLIGNAGAGTSVVYTSPRTDDSTVLLIEITMLDTDKPSKQVRLELDPAKVSKEAEGTSDLRCQAPWMGHW